MQQFYVLPTQCIYVFCVDLRTNSAVNTLRLIYKNQSVNAVWGNDRSLFSDSHRTHKQCGQNVEFLKVKMVHIVTSLLGVFMYILRL
jgi:uncharacterized FAD-dependent dehydrogenase